MQLISSVPGIWLHQYKASVHFQNCEFTLSQWTRPTGVWFASGHELAECCVCERSVVTLCRIWLDIYVGVVSTVGWNWRVRDSVIKVDCNYLMFEFFWQEPLWWICMACKPLLCSLYIFRWQITFSIHYALCTMHYALCTMHYTRNCYRIGMCRALVRCSLTQCVWAAWQPRGHGGGDSAGTPRHIQLPATRPPYTPPTHPDRRCVTNPSW